MTTTNSAPGTDDDAQPGKAKPRRRQPKAEAAWAKLNERQRTWLRVIYGADQDEEKHQNGAYLRGDPVVPMSVWRWQEYEPTRKRRRGETAKRGLLQERLDELEVRDPGAGSTIKVLEDAGLIEVRYRSDDPSANRMGIKLTRHGRATARAGGVDDTRAARSTKERPLSEARWRMMSDVARDPEGRFCRWGYVHEAWDWFKDKGLVHVVADGPHSRIRFTDDGLAHYREQWSAYVRMYPAVAAPHPDGEPVWPVEVDRALATLKHACQSLASEARALAEKATAKPPELEQVDRSAPPEIRLMVQMRNKRIKAEQRRHALLEPHRDEAERLRRVVVNRYLALAGAAVTAVAEDTDPVKAVNKTLRTTPPVLDDVADLPYPRTGLDGVDKNITTARPGTSHRHGKRAPAIPTGPVSTDDALAYAEFLHDLVHGGHLARLLLRREPPEQNGPTR